jgi:hypothetical protein
MLMHQYKEELIDVSQMLLDPNNFRFQNAPDFVFADPKRFAEASVQSKAFERLRAETLLPLKQSILKNGFLPFERLVVRMRVCTSSTSPESASHFSTLHRVVNSAGGLPCEINSNPRMSQPPSPRKARSN